MCLCGMLAARTDGNVPHFKRIARALVDAVA
jgi:hypothetical protein